MNMLLPSDAERLARAVLTTAADPGDPLLARLLGSYQVTELIDLLRYFDPSHAADLLQRTLPGLDVDHGTLTGQLTQWARRMAMTPAPDPHGFTANGGQFLIPGDFGYPDRLCDLGQLRPVALWARGRLRLGDAALAAPIAVLGTAAASRHAPKTRITVEIARVLARRGWAILTDAATDVADLAASSVIADGGAVAAVLGSGLDAIGSTSHPRLAHGIGSQGVLVTELPDTTAWTRQRDRARERLIAAWPIAVIAALTNAASDNDPAVRIARLAAELGRPVMVVRDERAPVPEAERRLLTDGTATPVTTAKEVIAHLPDEV